MRNVLQCIANSKEDTNSFAKVNFQGFQVFRSCSEGTFMNFMVSQLMLSQVEPLILKPIPDGEMTRFASGQKSMIGEGSHYTLVG